MWRVLQLRSHPSSSAFCAAVVLSSLLAACSGDAPLPQAAQGFQDDFAQEFCRFGSMEGSTSRGYGCVDGEFRAWIDMTRSRTPSSPPPLRSLLAMSASRPMCASPKEPRRVPTCSVEAGRSRIVLRLQAGCGRYGRDR